MTDYVTQAAELVERLRDDNSDFVYTERHEAADLIARLSAELAARSGGKRYRHKKRGTEYTVIGEAELQMGCDLLVDGSAMLVYQGDDGQLWVREESEFLDGRFEEIPAISSMEAPSHD